VQVWLIFLGCGIGIFCPIQLLRLYNIGLENGRSMSLYAYTNGKNPAMHFRKCSIGVNYLMGNEDILSRSFFSKAPHNRGLTNSGKQK